ncbi:MBL fold metallo-hydrolase, partial [Mycolicibacter sinensis]|uniref:MBL fold metallo-hydrolase n=1 Tax=Mycolicibacter sinensis (strain JDM601) TaxID=875328 RepID=UPI000ABC3FB4
DPDRAGPSTLIRAGGQALLIDCGRGVLQRLAAAGASANTLSALLLTHLHSDHIADLGDLLITRWVTTFTPDPAPLPIIGPPGTADVVEATLRAFGHDIGYRIAHHADLTAPPPVEVHEHTAGPVWDRDGVQVTVAPTDHRPVTPTIGFRIEHAGASVVLAGDTVPCASLDELAAGAGALGGRGGFGHRGVVVADVADPLLGQCGDEVLADHGVDQRAGAGGQLIEAGAGHGVPGQYHRS